MKSEKRKTFRIILFKAFCLGTFFRLMHGFLRAGAANKMDGIALIAFFDRMIGHERTPVFALFRGQDAVSHTQGTTFFQGFLKDGADKFRSIRDRTQNLGQTGIDFK